MNRPGWDEHGSGTVYSLGVIAVLLAAAVGIAGLIQAQSATGRARAAADLAAISGATVLSSVVAPGDPCAMAQRVATANGDGKLTGSLCPATEGCCTKIFCFSAATICTGPFM